MLAYVTVAEAAVRKAEPLLLERIFLDLWDTSPDPEADRVAVPLQV